MELRWDIEQIPLRFDPYPLRLNLIYLAPRLGQPVNVPAATSLDISQFARDANSPERGHLARLGRSDRVSGRDARAPTSR